MGCAKEELTFIICMPDGYLVERTADVCANWAVIVRRKGRREIWKWTRDEAQARMHVQSILSRIAEGYLKDIDGATYASMAQVWDVIRQLDQQETWYAPPSRSGLRNVRAQRTAPAGITRAVWSRESGTLLATP